jgi:hypothetical protein
VTEPGEAVEIDSRRDLLLAEAVLRERGVDEAPAMKIERGKRRLRMAS